MHETTWSSGGVVLARSGALIFLLIVERHRNVEPKWSPVLRQLPKGGLAEGETMEAAAVREVTEETGFDVRILGAAGEAAWSYERGGRHILEKVQYFLMTPTSLDNHGHDDEFDEVTWVSLNDGELLLSYPEEKAILENIKAKATFYVDELANLP
jgi:8-oxo-dGTP diphosphatase